MKKPNRIAAVEKAISQKYGDEAIQDPRANWDEDKEKEYLEQSQEFYKKSYKNSERSEKVDINGIKVSKKLFNRDSLKHCSVCSSPPKKTSDDVYLLKFECCHKCYIQYVEDREERWLKGWRPHEDK